MSEYTREELEQMVYSENPYDRWSVAKKGIGLEILINDENAAVRIAVAQSGYGLDKLVNDEDKDVRNVAKDKLEEKGFIQVPTWVPKSEVEDISKIIEDYLSH